MQHNSIYISNNPPDFNEEYLNLQDKDFLLHHLTSNAKSAHFNKLMQLDLVGQKEMLSLQRLRPVSDCCYVPIKYNNRLYGFIGIAREGLNNKTFDENELKVIQFVASFLEEGLQRSLAPPEVENNQLFMNNKGEVLKAGTSSQELFEKIFGKVHWNSPLKSKTKFTEDFLNSWQNFTSDIMLPGSSKVIIKTGDQSYILELSYIDDDLSDHMNSDDPLIKLTINPLDRDDLKLDYPDFIQKFNFSQREQQVIECIFRGATNDQIAWELKISQSTVKKHIWNIFNKAGVDNRTSLIFSLT